MFSETCIDPSLSPFIKNRVQIISYSENYPEFLTLIKAEQIKTKGFKVEYIVLKGDSTEFNVRRDKLKDIGYCIDAEPNFSSPTITYAIGYYNTVWYFGILEKPNPGWHIHKNKPCSFSNSINMDIAKSLVSLALKGNTSKKLLDACCGVGTIILEACFLGIDIEGCDINPRACTYTKKNLAHYNYSAVVHCSDIKDLDKKYDSIIIDLPYNLYSYSTDLITANIIESAARLSKHLVIVSVADIKTIISNSGLKIKDSCCVEKRGKSKFSRIIWICERD